MAESSKLVLGYWGIRGLAQPIRFFLDYLQVPYEDKRYSDREVWNTDKAALNTAFPNLPYIIDGAKVYTESDALFHYIAYKVGKPELVAPKDPENFIRLATIRGVLSDLQRDLSGLVWNLEYKKIYDDTINNKIKPRLERMSKYLGDRTWFAGEISYIDFKVQEALAVLYKKNPDLLDANLTAYLKRFNDLPAIKATETAVSQTPFAFPGMSNFFD